MTAITTTDPADLVAELSVAFVRSGIAMPSALSDMTATIEPPVAGRRSVTYAKPVATEGQSLQGVVLIASAVVILITTFGVYGFLFRRRMRKQAEKPPKEETESEDEFAEEEVKADDNVRV